MLARKHELLTTEYLYRQHIIRLERDTGAWVVMDGAQHIYRSPSVDACMAAINDVMDEMEVSDELP
jgi:hypothetical protein